MYRPARVTAVVLFGTPASLQIFSNSIWAPTGLRGHGTFTQLGVGCPDCANSFVAEVEIKMNKLVSLLLENDVAKRQPAEVFQSEKLLAASRRPTAILGVDSRRAAGRYVQQVRRSFGSCLLQSALVRVRTGIAPLTRKPPQYKRDMSVSSFVLVLVFVGVALAAFTDRSPEFSSFQGPGGATPPAVRTQMGHMHRN